jgi:hypothetical protein
MIKSYNAKLKSQGIRSKVDNYIRLFCLLTLSLICQPSFSQDCIDPGIFVEPDPIPLPELLEIVESELEEVEDDLAEMEDFECYNYSEFCEDYGNEAAEEMIEELTETNRPEREKLEEEKKELEDVKEDLENEIDRQNTV